MRQYTGLLHSVPMKQRAALMGQGLSTAALAWAFHSHAEEELLSLVPCVQSGRISWTELRAVGVGWWLRSQESLRRLAEKVIELSTTVWCMLLSPSIPHECNRTEECICT